jgi:hypothetical protein
MEPHQGPAEADPALAVPWSHEGEGAAMTVSVGSRSSSVPRTGIRDGIHTSAPIPAPRNDPDERKLLGAEHRHHGFGCGAGGTIAPHTGPAEEMSPRSPRSPHSPHSPRT